MKINYLLLNFALNSLLRTKTKSFFITLVLTILVFLLASILFIANSIKFELFSTLEELPEIVVQKIQAGRHSNIETKRVDELLKINGIQSAIPRVWGYYYFQKAGVNFSVVGIDEYDKQYKKSFENVVEDFDFEKLANKDSMVVGRGVKEILSKNYYKNYFNFIMPNGNFKKVYIASTFKSSTSLESNDIILMPTTLAREIFGLKDDLATDIVLKVANKDEIPTIVKKIKFLFPDSRVITNEDLKVSYQNIFDYKSGLFLALFVVAIFTFGIIIYDRASGLSSEEKKEIGILKALGWTMDDILKEKFYESFIVSFVAFLIGIILAQFFVYFLNAPILKDIFIGYSRLKPPFELEYVFDFATIALLFFLSVPLYIASIIIPSWKIAIQDADEVMR